MPIALLALFIAAFALGTAEFVIAGVLPDVARGLDVSEPTAGYLVSGYAIGIAIGGPALALLTKPVPRKLLIILLCAIFTLGQAFCALAPNFELLMAARVLVAVAHGTYFGIAAIVATSVVPPEKQGFAVSLLLAGLTVSNILGVPAGTAIGTMFDWRATFWAVGAVGLIATIASALWLPDGQKQASEPGSFLREIKALGRQQVITSLFIVILVMIGQYSLFTYIAPLLRDVTGLDAGLVPWFLLLFGVGATIGVLIGGRLADWKLMPSLIAIMAVQALMYVLVYLVSPNPWLMAAITLFWGGANFAFGSPVQTRILQWAGDAPNLASTLVPAGFNVGIAIGAVLGANLLEANFGYRTLPLIGAVSLALAWAIAVYSFMLEKRSGATLPTSGGAAPAAH